MNELVAAATQVLEVALARPATLGSGRLVCIDGPSGAGKSELAGEIARQQAATVVHTDDICPGWDGLARMTPLLKTLLDSLSTDQPGRYPRYDWILGRTAEQIAVEPVPLLVLEGVGAGARAWADLTTVLVWIDAPTAVRQLRAFARDGEHFRPHWDRWAAAESDYFSSEHPADRADLRFGTGS